MANKAELVKKILDAKKFFKLKGYRPYGHPDTLVGGELWERNRWREWTNKPWQLDFHNSTAIERMLMAANRVGKTECAAAEVSFHLTGDYPDWWTGKRFTKPILAWVGSVTNESSRDITQKALLGGIGEELGTGFVPIDKIDGKPATRQAGISNVIDTFKVRHVSGGRSECVFKTYDQGWRKWQGTAPEVVWMDEEPGPTEADYRIFTESQTRILSSNGTLMVTFTPLQGETRLVEHFANGDKDTYIGGATWDDAPHLDKDQMDSLLKRYPDYERDARSKGIPMLGSGAVFPFPEEQIKVDPFPIPSHFARIAGVDFGLDHPAAGAWIAWDRDRDIIYLYDCYQRAGATPDVHAPIINKRGQWIPTAWPHDGNNRDKGKSSGLPLKDQYRVEGVNMMSQSARYRNDTGGAQPIEPIVTHLYERFQNGTAKVFSTCQPFFDEYRSYHRKDGVIVARRDDVIKAFFYAVMMRRYAIFPAASKPKYNQPAPMRI